MYPELLKKQVDRGPSLAVVMQGFEKDTEALWEAKATHDVLFQEVVASHEDMAEIAGLIPSFRAVRVSPKGHLKIAPKTRASLLGRVPAHLAKATGLEGTDEVG